jgi:hypothetical protein
MFLAYLAIFRPLFTFRNRCTALDLKSIYFSAIALSLFTLKYICLRTKLFFIPMLFSTCGVHVCAPFVCVFPLVECLEGSGKPQETSIRIVDIPPVIQTGHLPNSSHKCYCLKQFAQLFGNMNGCTLLT